MSGIRDWLLHPKGSHPWRWRTLSVWVIAFSLLIGWSLQTQHDDARRAERIAKQTGVQNTRQQTTIVMLCNRGYILDGLVQAAIVLVAKPPNPPADREFVRMFSSYHEQLVDQLTAKDSPCVAASR